LKSSAELRLVAVSSLLLAVFVVTASASAFGSESVVPIPEPVVELPAVASSGLLLHGAPPPLLIVALGTLIVVAVTTRRMLRGNHEADDSSR
jgi:hypothetical protein